MTLNPIYIYINGYILVISYIGTTVRLSGLDFKRVYCN